MKPTLLILAAGMGSRYGGLKQIDPVGPNGETIIDYSIYDALRAGFGKLVFVVRRDIEQPFKEIVGARFEKHAPVKYVFQELGDLPTGFSLPAQRTKPWGTGQAILAAADVIHEPFGVINADDFYGADSFRQLAKYLSAGGQDYSMVGFILRNTLSEHGSVSRGVCQMTDDGYLQGVTEISGIQVDGNGGKYTDGEKKDRVLDGDTTVSMNLWGFQPGLFGHLRVQFAEFLNRQGQEEKSEFYIPAVVNALVQSGAERCKVLRSPDSWFGVTYREDRPRVVESVRALIARGDYPEKLWS